VKDNPLQGASRHGNQTIWLDRETGDEARDKFWAAFQEYRGREALHDEADHRAWDIAWAAAIAAFSYVMEGRIGPR
jgi:hypothetical protein